MNSSKMLRSVRITFTTSMTFECGFHFRFIFETFISMTSISSEWLDGPSFLSVSYLHSNASSSSRHLLISSYATHHREQEKKKKTTTIDFFPHRTNSLFCLNGELWWSQRWVLVVAATSIVVSRQPSFFLHYCCASIPIVHC